ncbi:glycoside hydrolase family 2 TIM barrel-domain containing protein [Flavobacterium aquatile]|uniref:beta-galactosidase n=1 Tax=Flavobacterium aquatile LMG 4008 = ATCC 11947 TaxID=1453498 RepID=A0A095SSH8_9FLAO|nr:glycoside hydrolase family 2 TIM barrel-domain containing protein [Flavobacterium aquatile]KGD67329.1 glycosidase [Flavobacterium aquatile LMG 4008 = ATCC 11947]OXA66872.1 glycosidase [Flavobacterium aquatile] [Flavobacterium aquatile LMG 4008 = ATCC 11947]
MKKLILILIFCCFSSHFHAQSDKVTVLKDKEDFKLLVNNKPFFINGMNWNYDPIGTNYNYSLWKQSDDVIKAALDNEMGLLKNMGVNAVRQYTGIQPKWITYIYEKYGIYTMLNHSFGRYGLTINGSWVPNTEYSNPATRQLLLKETQAMIQEYKNTPGLLLFLLGNENNYGLFWDGAETENIPLEDRKSTKRAKDMYSIFNEAVVEMKKIDTSHPIAICNGDLLFLDIIAEECKDIDIFGTNMYRGVSFGNAFQEVKSKLNKPILFTEFGADAFNAIDNAEDQKSQAYYMVNNWKEIYQNAANLGKSGNSLGGFTFQFSDGWWKFGQTKNLDVHDSNASWSNGGYTNDFLQGQNNMNEEWFGVCAKGPVNPRGLYDLYPRAAYYSLKEAHNINPYEVGTTLEGINTHFSNIKLMDGVLKARGDKAALVGSSTDKLRISNLRAEFTTFNTGGSLITTPDDADPDATQYPNQLGFDHMQSYYVGVEGNPTPNMKANVNVNILGNVALNPINEIFYENRGRAQMVNTPDGPINVADANRVQIYNASYSWNEKYFDLRGFYRTGHYHWGYEGDFFGLYPEANYGPNLDIYNGEVSGFEFDGKKSLNGLKAAFGPQLWWGANPAVLLKYGTKLGKIDATAVYHEDIDDAASATTSIFIPQPKTRRATLHFKTKVDAFGLELGGIWGGQPLNGRTFQYATGTSGNYTVYDDKVKSSDNWGGKAKITFSSGKFNIYTQGAIMGLVANGGADATQTFTGWRLKDSGSGNQMNFLAGLTFNVNSNFQIAPNFLWQKPLVAAMPNDVDAPGRLRNIQSDPFIVRANRETLGGELLLTYDPTPATWMYEWDNDMSEDAKFAFSTGFVFRHLPTTQDAAIGFLSNRTSFAFENSAPAHDLWESNTRIVSKISPELGLITNFYFGNGQSNGSDARLIERIGGDMRLIYRKVKLTHSFKINDWGPFDYHRDFNLTYPVQLMLDLSTSVGKPDWFILPNTKIGIMGTWRSLDQYSPRYSPTEVPPNTYPAEPVISPVGFGNGSEWEIRTYIHINIGK